MATVSFEGETHDEIVGKVRAWLESVDAGETDMAAMIKEAAPVLAHVRVADTFNRLYYFERAAETYIRALQTGQPLRVLSDEIAERSKSKPSTRATPSSKEIERGFDKVSAL